MTKIKDIYLGFKNLLQHKEITDANKKLDICNSCDKKTKINTCGVCGCYIPAKTKSPNSSCPINKW